MMVATITKDGYNTQIGIAISYIIIQFTDNHFLIPYIVSAKVRINALLSVVAVLLGRGGLGAGGDVPVDTIHRGAEDHFRPDTRRCSRGGGCWGIDGGAGR